MKFSNDVASLVVAFQKALHADFIAPHDGQEPLNLILGSAANEEESQRLDECVAENERNSRGRKPECVQAELAFEIAEIKAEIALRTSHEAKLAEFVDVKKTHDRTDIELEDAGAPHLAHVVRLARWRNGL